MDELKLLIEMVAGLPSLMVWVLVGYLLYKIAVIGSIFGIVRLAIIKAHDWLTGPRRYVLSDKTIDDEVAKELEKQIKRLSNTAYIHMSSVNWIRDAIDKREERK